MKQIIAILSLIIISLNSYSQGEINFDFPEKYNWKILSVNEDDYMKVTEYIPEKDNAEKWELLIQITRFNGNNIPLDTITNLLFHETKKTAPKAKLTHLEKEENKWILFKIESPEFIENPTAESQLWYIINGENSMFICFIAIKEEKLKKKFIKEWSLIFKAGEIIESSE